MEKKIINTDKAPKAIGAYVQATVINNMVYTSGQLGFNPATMELMQGIEAQTTYALQNLKAVLEAAGSSMEKVVKTTVFLADINDFAAVNTIYAEFFGSNPPARSALQVGALPKGGLVEIEAVAYI
ncbi:MAG: RidA family protein [Spirochaetaceae bacterium]|nr:RidA family protein [Spirochaetaceae bacterium]